jgi:hypothetical protein
MLGGHYKIFDTAGAVTALKRCRDCNSAIGFDTRRPEMISQLYTGKRHGLYGVIRVLCECAEAAKN